MYHTRVYDVCWSCRRRVVPEQVDKKGEQNKKGKGALYRCCGRFWIITNCRGGILEGEYIKKHFLAKYGSKSFHATEEENLWSCICPKCGDVLHDGIPPKDVKVRKKCRHCGGEGYKNLRSWKQYHHEGMCFKCRGKGYKYEYPYIKNEVNITNITR